MPFHSFVTVRSSPLRLLLLALTVGVGGLLLGCGSASKTTAPGALPGAFPNHSASEIRTAIQQPTDSLQRFSADARVTVQSPQKSRSFNADIRQQRADSLFMRFSLFGFEGGRMLLTPDSVFFYDSRKQTLRVGPLTEAQELFPAPLSSGNVFVNLLGLIAPNNGPRWTVTADSARYYLANPAKTKQWTVDPRRWRVVRFERRGPDGNLIEVRSFSDFQEVEGVALPHTVLFQRPADDVSARLDYRSIDLNPTGLSYALEVPASVPRKPLRAR